MKQNIIIYFLLFISIIGSAAKAQIGIGTEKRDSTFKVPARIQDNPIAAMLDSLATLQFFDRTNNLYDVSYNNIHSFAKDFVPFYSDDVYMARFAQLDKTSPVPLVYNRQVKEMIELYAVRKRGLTQRMLGLAQLYFPMIEEMLDRYGIPLEMKYLAIVESALNPIARSPVGAGGLWQFMYGTGKQYNLDVNSYVDERSDPYKSTIAACKYLKDLYKVHKDWLLVMAAYNSGSGNVSKAIRRSGGKTNFWEISPFLPKETRSYVPAFIAVTYLMNHASDHNLFPVMPLYKYHEIDTVAVKDFLTFDILAEKLNVSKEEISFLNPAFRKGVIPSTSTKSYFIRLPKRVLPDFVNNEASLYAYNQQKLQIDKAEVITEVGHSQESFFHYVKHGETLASIGKHYDVSSSDIRKWNHITRNSVRKGQRLIINRIQETPEENLAAAKSVPQESHSQVTDAKVESQSLTQAMRNSHTPVIKEETADATILKHHIVKKNERMSEIADIYGVSITQIKKWNRLRSSVLKSGKNLKIYVTEGAEPLLAEQKPSRSEKMLASKTVSDRSRAKQDKEPKAVEESEFHKVKSGESLDKLSKTYNVSIAHLIEWNNLNSKGHIMPGQRLIVNKAAAVEKEAVYASTEHATKKNTPREEAPAKTYAVKRGDSFSSISKRFSMTIAELKALNSRIGEELKFGQRIFVSGIPPMAEKDNSALKGYASGNIKQHGKRITYKVQPGDTLWSIVKKHKGTSIDELKELNNLKSEDVIPGQIIKIVVAS